MDEAQVDNLYLVLGCYGRVENEFVSCNGIQNRILEINDRLYGYEDLLNYFDNCRLYDRPLFDYNALRNFIAYLQEKFDQPARKLFTERQYQLYQKFIIDHRHCGLYAKLVLSPDKITQLEHKAISIFIEKENDSPIDVDKNKLKLVKGK